MFAIWAYALWLEELSKYSARDYLVYSWMKIEVGKLQEKLTSAEAKPVVPSAPKQAIISYIQGRILIA